MTAISEWAPYSGEYLKRWYDVKLKNGDIVKDCWPNAGFFHSFDEEDQFKGRIPGSEVAEVQEVDDPFYRDRLSNKGGKRRQKRRKHERNQSD